MDRASSPDHFPRTYTGSCPPSEPDGIYRCPASNLRIIVPRAEAERTRIGVVEAAREAERLESGVGVRQDLAEGVIIDQLDDFTGCGIDHQPWAAQGIGDDPVCHAALDQVVGNIIPGGIDKAADQMIAAVQLGNRPEIIQVQEALRLRSVDLLADAAVPPIH